MTEMQQRRRVRIMRRGGDVSELAGGTSPNGMGQKGAATELTQLMMIAVLVVGQFY